jgi:hypothetical protein
MDKKSPTYQIEKLEKLILPLIIEEFYGKIELSFEKGLIVAIKKAETIKLNEIIDNKNLSPGSTPPILKKGR